MRRAMCIGMLLLLCSCTSARMAGFDDLATQAPLEAVLVSGVPGWSDGAFRIGPMPGSVRRLALTDAVGWGPDTVGSAFDNVRVGVAARYGTMEFSVTPAHLDAVLEGRCRYGRTEVRGRSFGLDLAAPAQPLRLNCAYRVGGRDAGLLEMTAVAPDASSNAEPRTGFVRVDGRELTVRSRHRIEGTAVVASEPIGYSLHAPDGSVVGAVETGGAASRRILLPRSSRDRAAATAAMLTLALFWDPGNVG